MNASCTYRFESYKTAFMDYEMGVRKFHEGILALTLEDLTNDQTLSELRHELGIKHQHFVQCAYRMLRRAK